MIFDKRKTNHASERSDKPYIRMCCCDCRFRDAKNAPTFVTYRLVLDSSMYRSQKFRFSSPTLTVYLSAEQSIRSEGEAGIQSKWLNKCKKQKPKTKPNLLTLITHINVVYMHIPKCTIYAHTISNAQPSYKHTSLWRCCWCCHWFCFPLHIPCWIKLLPSKGNIAQNNTYKYIAAHKVWYFSCSL